MFDLTIHDIDDDVIKTLEARASKHGRSLEAEARAILVTAARMPTPEEVRARAKEIAARPPSGSRSDSDDGPDP